MPTIGSKTKTIRISPVDLEIIEGLMEDGTTWSGAVHKLCQAYTSVPVNFENKDQEIDFKEISSLKSIEEMVGLCGCTLEDFLKEVDVRLTDGTLIVENGRLVLPDVNTDDFCQVCHDKCLDPQSVLEKATKAVERGML